MMHAFSLVVLTMCSHVWAKDVITKAQAIVTFFRASHRPHVQLEAAAKVAKITTSLVTSTKTRFNSVYMCMRSVLVNEGAFRELDLTIYKKSVTAILEDVEFWRSLGSICEILQPFNAVITAIQGPATTMADVYLSWLYLARQLSLKRGVNDGTDLHALVVRAVVVLLC
jgi:hypothetical protein